MKQLSSDMILGLTMGLMFALEEGDITVAQFADRFGVPQRQVRELAMQIVDIGVCDERGEPLPEYASLLDYDALMEHDTLRLSWAAPQLPVVLDFSAEELRLLLVGLTAVERDDAGCSAGAADQELGAELRRKLGEYLERAEQVSGQSHPRPADEGEQGAGTPAAATGSGTETAHARQLPRVAFTGQLGEALDRVREAIAASDTLRIVYRTLAGSVSERTVWPYELRNEGDDPVLYAYCMERRDFRKFRLHSMLAIEAGEPVPADVVVPAYSEWSERQEVARMDVRARVSARGFDRIKSYGPQVMQRLPGGYCEVLVQAFHESVPERLVRLAPGEIEILAPAKARERVAAVATSAVQLLDHVLGP